MDLPWSQLLLLPVTLHLLQPAPTMSKAPTVSSISLCFLRTSRSLPAASGHRELLAVREALKCPPPVLQTGRSTSVFWLTNLENVVTFLTKGSPKKPIQETVLEIFKRAHALHLDIIPIHIKQSDFRIEIADFGSRYYDPDDWSCDTSSFEELTKYWKVSIDLFGHYSNAQVSRFYSFGLSPHTTGVDAFAFSWDQETAWCCPPISLVIPAVRKIASSLMQAILIVPAWRSAQFWPFLFPDGLHAIDMCVSLCIYVRPDPSFPTVLDWCIARKSRILRAINEQLKYRLVVFLPLFELLCFTL